ncbi:MAG: hypothetical protein MRY83_20725 [Flavobacteriales bacterium]|nr:hypothetical protein [Flavobacteriales bacterium]
MIRILLISFLSFPLIALSQDYGVKVHGVENLGKFPKNGFSSNDTLFVINKVLNLGLAEGYLECKLDSIGNEGYFFSLGPQYSWENIKFTGDSVSKARHNRSFQNAPVNIEYVKNRNLEIINQMENSGYPFARIVVDSIGIKDSTLSYFFDLESGPLITIDSLIILGNAGINQKFIENYIDVKSGDLYAEQKMQSIKDRIDELPFASLTQNPAITFDGTICKLELGLKKKKASKFNGILGVLSNAEDGKVLLQGDMNVNLHGALGQGEQFNLAWNALQESQQKLEISLYYPYLFNSNLNIKGDFELFRRDTLFNNVFAKASLGYLLRRGNYFNFFLSRKQSNILYDQLEGLNLNQLDFETNTYGVDFNFAKLDYRLNPRKGTYILGNLGLGRRRIKKTADLDEIYDSIGDISTQINLKVDVGAYLPLAKNITLNVHSETGWIQSDFNLENEMFRLGGLRTIRGFDEESIFANAYAIGRVEPRYLFEKNSVFFLFFEYGRYINDGLVSNIDGDLYSFGFGTNFETKAGILTLSYGLGRNIWVEDGIRKDSQLQLRSAKVHLGIINYF